MSRIVHSSTFTEKASTPTHSTYNHNIIVILEQLISKIIKFPNSFNSKFRIHSIVSESM